MSDTKLDLDALEREAEAMRSFSAWRIIARFDRPHWGAYFKEASHD
ncbi:hypothetical protein [Cupriavidus sp. D39]|nr:hypothetical protein [Cupriavidus sp. D39]MCY0854314.1 hypothetical protein [Cupriavidus sp. D39]